MGYILEKPILESYIRERTNCALEINGAYTVGLVAKTDYPWAQDSIDFILTVTPQNGEFCPGELNQRHE